MSHVIVQIDEGKHVHGCGYIAVDLPVPWALLDDPTFNAWETIEPRLRQAYTIAVDQERERRSKEALG